MSRQLREIARPLEPVAPSDSGADVYARFQADPDCLALAVLDSSGAPVGIVERNSFFLQMAAEYGRALYGRRPIEVVMNRGPVSADGRTPIADFCRDVLARRPSELMHGFIVTKRGRYAGVGTALDLLKAASDAAVVHAEEMARTIDALKLARNEAQTALDARTRFLAVMNHEIRTPLNGVLAVAELVARRLQQEELKPYVSTILASGETLLRLLTDALDLSRAGAQALQLIEAPFALEPMLEEVKTLWTPRAADKGIGFVLRSNLGSGAVLCGDAVRLKQILNNLIGNAIKFTDAGGVDASLSARAEGDAISLHVEVADTGPGVPEDDVGRLFSPFAQTEEGLARGGAGLGLSVCRELAELMGGAVGYRPNAPSGSVFWFEARLKTAQAPSGAGPAESGQETPMRSLHVLIADDNATNRLVASTLCEQLGCRAETVGNGAEALQAASGGRFDLVLMDIRMPVMDGVTATRAIRALPGELGRIPVIALTANADPLEAARYRREGVDGVVQKPIKVAALAEAMAAVMERAPVTVAATA